MHRKLEFTELLAHCQEEALVQSGAKRYERTNSRKASRNGYKPRTLKTKYGELELLKPQFREFPFETQVFEKYSRVEKAILAAVSESYRKKKKWQKGKKKRCRPSGITGID